MRSVFVVGCLALAAESAVGQDAIWQIGRSDNNHAEFAISGKHSEYNRAFPKDVVFRVGRDEPGKHWSFIHPGPSDAWAGGRPHTFRIVFALDKPVTGTLRLVVDLVNTHSHGPPLLEVDVNGHKTRLQTQHGAGDASLVNAAAGREQVLRVPFAGEVLRVGENTIELRNVGGSWMLYDAVRLERMQGDAMTAALHAELRPFVRQSPAGPRQELDVRIDACGPEGTLEVTVDGKTVTQPVPAGRIGGRSATVSIPCVKATCKTPLVFKAGKQVLRKQVELKPVRPWRIFLVQHTHSDVGYPDTQASLAARLVDFIDAAVDYASATSKYPDDAKFRWTCEATWSVDLFLATRGPEQIAALKRAIAAGQIELAALPMNMTDLATEEVWIQSLQTLARLRRVLGAEITAAMQNDVNGYPLCLPRLLSGCGVRYFSTGINRTRSIVPFDRPTGLHWESPDGASVLAWRGEHYMAGNYFGETTEPDRVAGRLAGYLAALEKGGYPHEAVLLQMSGYGTDDAWPSPRVCDLVKSWNEQYVWPKLRVATISEFFKAVEAADGDKLPRVRKAWCDWWADGNGTAVQEVALIRRTHEELESGLALLAASATKDQFPELPAKIKHAFQRTLMFDEHTWGYAGSIGQPTSWMTKAQWGYKAAQAREAAMLTASIYDAAREARAVGIPTTAPSLIVENPSSWPRGGVTIFRIPAPAIYGHSDLRLVDTATGKPVAVHRVSGAPIYDAMFAVDVPPVPALGYRVLRIDDAATPDLGTDLRQSGNVLESDYYWVEVDAKTGALFSLRDKRTNRELASKEGFGLLRYVYEQVKDGRGRGMFWPPQKKLNFDRAVPGSVTLAKGQDGPLVKSLHVRSRIGKGHTIDCELILYRRTPRLDVELTIQKPSKTSPEAGYLAMPLALDKPVFSLDAVGGTFRPGPGQIDRTASDYHSIQRYVRVTEATPKGLDVVVASRATPLVQIGGIHVGEYQERLTPPGPVFYMWLFNNYWFTNFPASQGGELRFGFSLTSSAKTDAGASSAHRFAVGYCTPLAIAYRRGGQQGDRPDKQAASVAISPDHVMITGMRWARDGQGVVMRLREFDGRAATARIRFAGPWAVRAAQRVDLLEAPRIDLPVKRSGIEIGLQPHEMVSIKLTP